MRNDQIFVLLLVILLPLSGCFDGAVGDANAEEDTGMTVINNYYNNTTTIMQIPDTHVLYIPKGTTGNLSTSNGELIEVLDVWMATSSQSDDVQDYNLYGLSANFSCSTHSDVRTASGIGARTTYPEMGTDYLPSDGTSCTYEFYTYYKYETYMIYRIH
jgi:hypothetical protein